MSSHVGCATWQPLADAQHYKNAEVCKFLEEHGGRSSVRDLFSRSSSLILVLIEWSELCD